MTEIVKKATIGNRAFWVCLSVTIVLIVSGFIVPPLGVIDGSVLTAAGELFAFATLFVVGKAIHVGVDARIRHGSTEVAIGDLYEHGHDNVEDDENAECHEED